MSVVELFGTDTDILYRKLEDDQPIAFKWSITEAVTIAAEVSFDNVNFINTTGTVIELGSDIWQLNFDQLDRPSEAGLVTYRFTDNLGNVDTIFLVLSGPVPEEDTGNLSDYGPKRVKTKEVEIEQFDPRITHQLALDKERSIPTFCNSAICIGYMEEEYYVD